LPVMDGLSVLRILKADAGLRDVPVLLVTQEADTASRERGLELGANDCVFKPYRPLEIQQRLREIVSLAGEDDRNELADGSDARQLGDPLTHLGTKSQLHISLDYEFTRAVRYKHALSCVVVACVNCAELSEARGRDEVIAPLANTIKGGIRTVDHLFRSEPFEFTILLPDTNHEGARIVVDRLRAMLREYALHARESQPDIAVTAASYPFEGIADAETLYANAKRALL
jgi:diguanylate cyclase (GGDEF)-like protein